MRSLSNPRGKTISTCRPSAERSAHSRRTQSSGLADILGQLSIGGVYPHHVLSCEFDEILPKPCAFDPVWVVGPANLVVGLLDVLDRGAFRQA